MKGTFEELETYCNEKPKCTGFFFANAGAGFYTDAQPETPVSAYMLEGGFGIQTTRKAGWHLYRKNRDDPESAMNSARHGFKETDWSELLENFGAGETGWWGRANVASKYATKEVCVAYADSLQKAVDDEKLGDEGGDDALLETRMTLAQPSGAPGHEGKEGDEDTTSEEEGELDHLLGETKSSAMADEDENELVEENEDEAEEEDKEHEHLFAEPVLHPELERDLFANIDLAAATSPPTTSSPAADNIVDSAAARRFEAIEKQLLQLTIQNARLMSENQQANVELLKLAGSVEMLQDAAAQKGQEQMDDSKEDAVAGDELNDAAAAEAGVTTTEAGLLEVAATSGMMTGTQMMFFGKVKRWVAGFVKGKIQPALQSLMAKLKKKLIDPIWNHIKGVAKTITDGIMYVYYI